MKLKNIIKIIYIVFLLIFNSCISFTDSDKPDKSIVKAHLKHYVKQYTGIFNFSKYDIIEYQYYDNIEEFSVSFTLKFNQSDFQNIIKNMDDLYQRWNTNLSPQWIYNENKYEFYLKNAIGDSIYIAINIENNTIEYSGHFE